MTLKLIRLELARTKEYPEGSAAHGYEFTAPLDAACVDGWSIDTLIDTVVFGGADDGVAALAGRP